MVRLAPPCRRPPRSCRPPRPRSTRPRSVPCPSFPLLALSFPSLTPPYPSAQDTPISTAELATHGASAGPDQPIWLAIRGTVFDVSAKREMYGAGGSYAVFAGKDGSRGLGGCEWSRAEP